MSGSIAVRRGFVDTSNGQVHYRIAGAGAPLLMCHASPGSSKQLERLISSLAQRNLVIAPDTPGNGDSSPLPSEVPGMADYARAQLEFMDAFGLDRVDVYGSHTGAGIAAEMAILAPERIGKVIQDGASIFTAEQREAHLKFYAHPFPADLDGAYLMRAFMFCRDQYFFFPWYARDKAHRRDGGLPKAQVLHDWVLEVLKSNETYYRAYRAAFAYPAEERLLRVRQPVLALGAEDDPLRPATALVARAMKNAIYRDLPRYDDSHYLEALTGAINGFLHG